MQLIEIDEIGAKPPEAVLARLAHVLRPRALPLLVDSHPEFRRHDRLMPSSCQRTAEELLALRGAVDVGGVEESDPGLERRADDALGRGLIDADPEVVAAQAHHRDTQRSDRTKLHVRIIRAALRYQFRNRPISSRNSDQAGSSSSIR